MKPLKQLPILRLPFQAMEEVSKRMHSIMKKMISNRRSNEFPILRLPFLAVEEIFKAMDPIEITHVLDIFKKQTINFLSMQKDAFRNSKRFNYDFLKTNEISVNDCYLFQLELNNVDKNVAYLLNNITIKDNLKTYLHINKYFFDGKIPKNLKGLYITDSRWIGYERLLEIDSKNVILENDEISNKEWNLFLKKWIAMETNVNLEYLQLSRKELETFRALVLYDIPHEVVDGGVKRLLKTRCNETQEISGGIDIRRIDGKTATFFVYREYWTESIAMSIH
ncbi:hypothetical protein CRE_31603 [Caenorhabditis remanei]|uniref:Sdz-33 F-box domain-containing protein n=1 Tax=Caenorhabditis remanei TaxID=31234 RepID=E3NRB9_CAERE|nr:hypothetical protein CRE_31603 [Caenorhabditis remanei]